MFHFFRLFLWGNVRLSHLKMASASCHCTRLASSMPNCALPGKPQAKKKENRAAAQRKQVWSPHNRVEATLKLYFNLLGNTQPKRRSRGSQQLPQNLPHCAPIGELSMHTFTRCEISASAAWNPPKNRQTVSWTWNSANTGLPKRNLSATLCASRCNAAARAALPRRLQNQLPQTPKTTAIGETEW